MQSIFKFLFKKRMTKIGFKQYYQSFLPGSQIFKTLK